MALRSGFSIAELVIVIAVITILVSILLPAVSMVRESARRTVCGNNQRNIVLYMRSFVEEHGVWPAYYANPGGLQKPYVRNLDGHQVGQGTALLTDRRGLHCSESAWTTAATFEMLASWSDRELSNVGFRCPTNGRYPTADPQPLLTDTEAWPAWFDLEETSYAYDFATPYTARSTRVVMADRPISPYQTAHGHLSVVAYADGRTGILNETGRAGWGGLYCTWNQEFDWVRMQVTNPDADDDNIYDSIGDAVSAGYSDVDGSATRAWVR